MSRTAHRTNEYTSYIPQLQRIGTRLCGNSICAQSLVAETLRAAEQKSWKKTPDLPTDAFLTMLLLQQHLRPTQH